MHCKLTEELAREQENSSAYLVSLLNDLGFLLYVQKIGGDVVIVL